MNRLTLWRRFALALLMVVTFANLHDGTTVARRQVATPTAYTCDTAYTSVAGTPMAGMDQSGMDMATPAASVEFDQLYIDMMIPHHTSIVALAEAALPRLEDERLRTLAETIIGAQTTEIEELRGYREQFYGNPEPMPMDEQAMMQMLPGMTMPMDAMMAQMDAATQVATFCAAADPDLAFIDLTIPHHQSAIQASAVALSQPTHAEIRAFAERVIEDQRREIDQLGAIRLELYGSATPEAVGG